MTKNNLQTVLKLYAVVDFIEEELNTLGDNVSDDIKNAVNTGINQCHVMRDALWVIENALEKEGEV